MKNRIGTEPDSVKKIFSQARKFGLLPEEKSLIKSRLVLFIQNHPVRDLDIFGQIMQSWSETLKLNLSIKSMIAALLIIALLTGSASALAEGSLPGSPLYPVKVGVNEKVRTFLSFSDDAKADWSIKIADRRLSEAEMLASSGNLSSENRVELETRFNSASDNFEDKIGKLEAKNRKGRAFELSSDFEAALKAHQDILAQLSFAKPQIKIEIEDLLEDVDSRAELVAKIRMASEARMATSSDSNFRAAAEGKLKALENKIEEVAKFLAGNKDRFDAEAYVKAEAKLNEARGKVGEGKIKIQEGKYVEAFAKFQEAMRIAQGAKLLTSSAAELNLKIEGNKLELEIEGRGSATTSSSDFGEDEDDIELELETSAGINL